MEHLPTQESDVEKVYRIARELGIGLEDAALTCDAFELAFSNERLRRSIFSMIEQLDESAVAKGEPLGLVVSYAVELENDGIRVGRYADEIPPGEIAILTPMDRANIFLRIKDSFPTKRFLGPLMVCRPEPQPVGAGPEMTNNHSDYEVIESVVCDEPPDALTYQQRFPFLSKPSPLSRLTGEMSSPDPAGNEPLARRPLASAARRHGRVVSGLSPPRSAENEGHSKRRKMSRRHLANL